HGALAKLLADKNPRAQTQAAIALSKLPGNHTAPVLAMLERSAGNDTALQHAGTLALANGTDTLANLANHKSIAVRTAALIALRRQRSSQVAVFLSDTDAHIQLEAARAIADAHIAEAMPKLARLAKRTDLAKPLMRRVLNANFRLANAAALATVAANEKQAKLARAEALNLLAAWENPSGRDRISGLWRPISGRNTAAAVTALGEKIDAILRGTQGLVRTEAIAAAARLKLNQAGPALLAIVKNESAGGARAKALQALSGIGLEQLAEAVDAAFESGDSNLLSAATRLATKVKPAGAAGKLESILAKGGVAEQQSALIALGDLADPAADTVIAKWLDKLLADTVTPPLKLELLEAAAKRNGDAVKTRLEKFNESRPGPRENPFALEPYAETLEGGDAAKGRTLFFENIALSCVRCHVIGEEGGEVGPSLDDIGSRVDRTHLLESIVNPSAKIAEGYDFFLILLKDDSGYVGIITKETATELLINSPEDGLVTVKTADVKERIKGPSGMPPGMQMVITKRELRDLIEYLATRKTAAAK
ncbi:MAG: c-type cytochrome, partial [Verrucomicrobia bacterium]|nr:c-type cytochrome [Verrucomicrobiota bacterium]